MQFMQNPAAFFQQRGMQMPPQTALQSPQGMIEYLMNSGGVSQQQYNQAAAQAKQMQQNPQFMQMMQGLFRR
ncbi:MAG: hypothetical protein J6S92_05095 [Oscillospiraceae bacterium]|nr:hypothetical protein [Oscillospiraceae bacterium]MBQ5337611.1 hypothetical protein [Oscillospiraceae bacterium]